LEQATAVHQSDWRKMSDSNNGAQQMDWSALEKRMTLKSSHEHQVQHHIDSIMTTLAISFPICFAVY